MELLEKLSVEVKDFAEDTDKLKRRPFAISKAVVTDNSAKTYESGVVTYTNLWSVDLDALKGKPEATRDVSFDEDIFGLVRL